MKGDYSQIQLCPKCDGQGYVSRPPWLPGDVTTWTSTQVSYLCDVCNGSKYFRVHLESCDDIGRLLAEINDFKCCGNCKLFFDNECRYFQRTLPPHYCDHWESDNMTQKERKE